MIASTHLAVGAAMGLMVQELLSPNASAPKKLFWAFASGVVSHVVLDSVSHQEYLIDGFQLGAMILVEAIIVFMIVLSSRNSPLINSVIFFGMAGGAVPDVLSLIYKHFLNWPWLGILAAKIHFFHGTIPLGFEVSVYIQATLALMAFYFVKIMPAK